MSFHVGQRVVCVDDKPRGWDTSPTTLTKGATYTIQAVRRHWLIFWWKGVELRELDAPSPYTNFWADRFRPVTERKTDISVFTAMLIDAPKEMERVDG